MLKKKSIKKVKKTAHHHVGLKQHFPTFYDKPMYAIGLLVALLAVYLMLK